MSYRKKRESGFVEYFGALLLILVLIIWGLLYLGIYLFTLLFKLF
jgi:hypothetical protein